MSTVVKAFFGTLAVLFVVVAVLIVVVVATNPMGVSVWTFQLSQRMHPLPTPTEIPHISCEQAQQLVYARHSTLFGVLSKQYAVTWQCAPATSDGLLPVVGSYTDSHGSHGWTYDVSLYGVVTPADEGALAVDRLASAGTSLLTKLP